MSEHAPPVLHRRWAATVALVLAVGTALIPRPAAAADPTPSAPVASNYSMIWNDEFDGSAIDSTKWATNWPDALPGQPYSVDLTAYNSSYVSEHDGSAWIKTDNTSTTVGGVTLPYQTGFMSTKNKFEAQYGYVEARMRHAASPTPSAADHTGIGAYHAFWMLPHYNDSSSTSAGQNSMQGTDVNGADGRGTELDIAEWGGDNTTVKQNDWFGGYGTGGAGFQGNNNNVTVANPATWHTYGLEWTPTSLKYYIDGTLTTTFNRGSARIPYYPEFLMLQSGIVNWQTAPNNLPDYLQVDYVRYFQQPSVTYEAEGGTLAGGAGIATNHSGYSGSGFVDGFASHNGASLTTNVDTAATASRTITVHYSAGPVGSAPVDRTIGLYLNGTKLRDITFAGTANWDTWADHTETLTIPGGAGNQITFKGERADDSDGINIDWISLPNSADVVSGNYVTNPEFGSNATSFGATSAKINNIAGWYQTSTGNADNNASYIEYGSDYSDRWNAVHYRSTAYAVFTGQDITVPNGTYSLSAYVRSSGGQTAQYMKATTSSGTQQVNIGAYSTYTKVTVSGIQVTDGHITIGFYSNALAGQWLAFDNVQLLAS